MRVGRVRQILCSLLVLLITLLGLLNAWFRLAAQTEAGTGSDVSREGEEAGSQPQLYSTITKITKQLNKFTLTIGKLPP